MLTTDRKATLLRDAVLTRLPLPYGNPAPLTDEEAGFVAQHHDAIGGLIAQLLAAVNAKAVEVATGRKLFPRCGR